MRAGVFVGAVLVVAFGAEPPAPGQPPPKQPGAPALVEPAELRPGDVPVAKTLPLAGLERLTGFSASPDGKVIGVSAGEVGRSQNDWSAFYIDTTTGKRLGFPAMMTGPGILTTGGTKVVEKDVQFGRDTNLMFRDVATGKQSIVASVKDGHVPVALTSDGKLLILTHPMGIEFLQVAKRFVAFPGSRLAAPVAGLSEPFLGDTRIAGLHPDGVVRVWDLTTGKETAQIDPKAGKTGWNELRVAGDGRAMTVANTNTGDRLVWDLKAGAEAAWAKGKLKSGSPMYRPMAGGRLYSVDRDYNAKLKGGGTGKLEFIALTDLGTGQVTGRLLIPEDPGPFAEVRVSRDGRRVLMLNVEKARLYVWDLPAAKE